LNYRYLTFDCYGTLIDWRAGIEKELRSVLGEIGVSGQKLLQAYVAAEAKQEEGFKRYREVLKDTVLSMSETLGKKVSDKAADAFASSVPRWPAHGDTAMFLRNAGKSGYKRYILSNVDDDILRETIRLNRLEVEGFVTAEQVGSYKPRPRHWEEFMSRTEAEKGDVLHVAQSVFHDIIPAGNLGIDSAWVNRYDERLPPGASPTIIADSLSSLSAVLGID
jgi:2-haloacid dehalogenase